MPWTNVKASVVLLCAGCLGLPAFGQPVPESERIPVDVRRTTLLVRDVDRSLAFWRDALGLTVIYDRVLGEPPRTTRLVLLRANDQFIGNIGLMHRSTDPTDVPVAYERATTGQVILVVNAKDQEQRLERVRRVPGVKIESEPVRIEYPSPDGKGRIPVMVTYLWDPDGYFVEVNKILGTPAGADAGRLLPASTPMLAEQENLVANCGVWQGQSRSVAADGSLGRNSKVTKTIMIGDNLWYQVNEYEQVDGTKRTLRFVGKPVAGGGIAVLSLDRPEVPLHPSVYRPTSARDGVLRSYDEATGNEVGFEAFSTVGRYRTITSHSYKWSDDKRDALDQGSVSLTFETRVGDAPVRPPFELSPGERLRLGL